MRLVFTLLLLSLLNNASAQTGFDVFEASITELQTALERGEITSTELVVQYLARIQAYDKQGPAINSIIRINPAAMELAASLDAEREASGARSLLHGIPIVVKDNYNTVSMPTTGGSVALANFRPTVNATQVDKLIAAGAIILAKTNLHEFAYGITTVSSLLGQTRNPYDIRRVPGGSSGGTGAAVAASFGAIGLGSDTCGSIRIPSAFNNLIGLRPSKGLSSIYGVMPLSHTQDVAGPLARSAEDLAIVLDIVKGYDPNDEATGIINGSGLPGFQEQLRTVDLSGLRIGRLSSYMERADNDVQAAIESALEWYQGQGVEIIDVEIPELGSLISGSGVIGHEFRVDLNQYLSTFTSPDVHSLAHIVDLGLFHQAVRGVLTRSRDAELNEERYQAALATRLVLRQAIETVFADNDLDAIVYPPIGETQVFIGESQPGNNCSIAANAGLPALSMPAGFSDDGLPIGMELLGTFFDDPRLLAIAYPYERALRTRQAPSTTPALEAGLAPATTRVSLSFRRAGVDLDGGFEFDVLTNRLHYELALGAGNTAGVYAVTLVIEEEAGAELAGPVVLNMLGPDTREASGSYFMSPQFRQAFNEERVYLKVFAGGLPPAGAMQPLR
jgi:Asp-tRNA(Asn)/Glu-tRNA(Gln) amidotransferase A subunit family amidase